LVLCHPRYFAKQGSLRQLAFTRRFPRLKNRFFVSPVVPLSKIFTHFPQQKPTFHPTLKNIFDFSFDAVFRFTYRHLMNSTLLTAVADSVATGLTVSVSVSDIDEAVRFIRRSFVDVDFDSFPDRVTIFGDDSSVWTDPDGDGDEGRFVLNLMRSVSLTANPFNE
jgi:hypothetical protein